ncbi:helix-turn-helix domain-containing protein [uncultured Paracoccus sp.]|uniref:helix-turn-helix domain-containing protein n=1 Tax=uncultured Paracoccus sp. TaxID=189685 RepID=UPI002619FDF0|nr:helix-turn-helix domain-containing protein [uncultured Paracoccus sp.]
MRHVTQTRTALAERSSVACSNLYELLGPVRILRKDLGLTSNDVAVLTALISFLPRERNDSQNARRSALTIVFPSNVSLSERANGIDERTLRRSLGRLEAAGLIKRKRSANGKRFPLRYGGVIRDAFGIALDPLIQNFDALAARASKMAEEREHLRSLKAEALALRASLLQDEHLDPDRLSTLETIKTILRRATLTAEAVLRIIIDLRKMGANTTASYGENSHSQTTRADAQEQAQQDRSECSQSRGMTARNGQNVRQIESIKKELNKIGHSAEKPDDNRNPATRLINREPRQMAWADFTHVSDFFPTAPQTGEALNRILFDIGKLLRIRQEKLARGLQNVGAAKLLIILDYLLGKADAIRQPEAYFETVVRA